MINASRLTGADGVPRALAGALMLATQLAALLDVPGALAHQCRPRRPLPIITLKTTGPCNFNAETLSFAGNAVEQAACLIRPVNAWARLGPPLEELPKALASRIGGIPELVREGRTGMLFEPGNASALATAMHGLAGGFLTLQRLAENSWDLAQSHSVERMVDDYITHYRWLLEQNVSVPA